jgi:type VI secretion system secreted protein VgrG
MRPTKATTPLGDALMFHRLTGREEIGRLFEYEVELLSTDETLSFTDVVGQSITIEIELPSGEVRHLDGICASFGLAGGHGNYARYRAVLRPWLWLLTRSSDCRIFQNKSAPDIIKEVFRDHGLTDFREASLSGNHPVREYCVQYRETDFAFVSRLMEEEGIYYFFEHEAGKHTLVLADSYSAHAKTAGYEDVPYHPKSETDRRSRDHVDEWQASESLEPGAYVLEDFDFERPKANLEVKLAAQHTLARSALEMYDYPGGYIQTADGEGYLRVRMEELYARQALARGAGSVRGLSPGALFSLTDFPRADQNKEYLVVEATYEISGGSYESGTGDDAELFRCTFAAIEGQRPFRPARVTPRPMVYGPQTAIVVGKSGEEIWTDAHGRVKLQFHWDRLGKSDEQSSCWVRVAQIWAGGKWGSIHLPRIGQEVIVEFLEGDPDRPIVTGRVYNGDLKVPYDLPANQSQSGIKSRSTKQGNDQNFNEIRFEDKKGSEHIYVQAEKDLQILVENDETRTVKHDRKKTVENDETTSIGHDRIEEVKNDETITVKGNRTETVEKDETITVKGNRTETVEKDETITVKGNRNETVEKDETVTVQGNRGHEISGDDELAVSGSQIVEVSTDQKVTVSGERKVTVSKNDKLDVSQKLTITAGQELKLEVGGASITLKASGDIIIKGVNVTVEGSASTKVKSSGMVEVQGSAVTMK